MKIKNSASVTGARSPLLPCKRISQNPWSFYFYRAANSNCILNIQLRHHTPYTTHQTFCQASVALVSVDQSHPARTAVRPPVFLTCSYNVVRTASFRHVTYSPGRKRSSKSFEANHTQQISKTASAKSKALFATFPLFPLAPALPITERCRLCN